MTPRVSVVLAVHNGERHIEQSLRSVLTQTFTDFELIAVDDGSTDRTPEILTSVGLGDARLRIVRQENVGLTTSLTRGIALARGAYVARQDADDVSRPERFEQQVKFLDRRPSVAAIGTGAAVIDDDGVPIGALTTPCGSAAVRRGLHRIRRTPVHGSVMMRRAALDVVGGYRAAFLLCQDYDLWLRMIERFEIDNVPDVLYQWRIGPAGIYATRRALQLKYSGIARAFAREREADGRDSYDLLDACGGDLDAFAERYGAGAVVHAIWGELLLRGLGNSRAVRQQFRSALRQGDVRFRTIGLCCWTHMGLPWPGGRPLMPPVSRNRFGP